MNTSTTTTAKIFLTDYASYNNGTQFEFGHWVDLTEFADAEEFNTYITTHFTDVVGLQDFEPMYTDFEGFPDSLYSESMNESELEKIFKYIELDYENKDDSEKISLWNEYCSEQGNGDEIYSFDEEFFEIFFDGKAMEASRATVFGSVNWSHEYISFDGYGNLKSLSEYESIRAIDENALIEWLIENL